MSDQPGDLVSRILAESDKFTKLSEKLDKARQLLEDGNAKLRVAKEKLEADSFEDMLAHSNEAVKYYEQADSFAVEVKTAESTNPDIDQLIKAARDWSLASESVLREGREIQFKAEDLKRMRTNVESEMAIENWDLVAQYAKDALAIYPNSMLFKHYSELAEEKLSQKPAKRETWFDRLFGRR